MPSRLARLVACPECGATLCEPCHTDDGAACAPHVARLVRQRCPCGELPAPGSAYCSPDCAYYRTGG